MPITYPTHLIIPLCCIIVPCDKDCDILEYAESTVKNRAAFSFETLGLTLQTTLHLNSEDQNRNIYCRQIFKFRTA
jgi:hypothetical protein